MTNYAALRDDRARRCNLPVTHGEIEALHGVTRYSFSDGFAGMAQRLHAKLFGDWVGARQELIPVRPAAPVKLGFEAAAGRFVLWMREMGFAGEHTEDQIRGYLDFWHFDQNVAKLPSDLVLGKVSRQIGVRKERKRVRDRPYPHNRGMFYTIIDRQETREQRRPMAA